MGQRVRRDQRGKRQLRSRWRNRIRSIKRTGSPADQSQFLSIRPVGDIEVSKVTRKSYEEVMKDMALFLQRLRYRYKKHDEILKYIYRIEIGKRGGIHVHILVNRTKCSKGTDMLITECWTFGFTHFTPLRETGGYKDLAEYIAKPVGRTARSRGCRKDKTISYVQESDQTETREKGIFPLDDEENPGRWTKTDTGILHRKRIRSFRNK